MNKLGFGFLRLPQLPSGEINWLLLEAMVDRFLDGGGRYFDTAYTYLDGRSEIALRQTVVERYPRSQLLIADKLPSWLVKSREDCGRYFREQCQRCGVDYFDVYLLHWLNTANFAVAERFDEFGFLNRLKAEGRIRKTGFSYHGDADTLEKILEAHPDVDVVQLQINYLDWDNPAMNAHRCYDIATNYGKEVIVMEPVKGGILADLPEEAAQLLRMAQPDWSTASWAIRFAQALPQVSTVLSGMNTMEQMEDNLRQQPPLSQTEYALLDQVSKILSRNIAIPCTGCRYCVKGCPKDIAIPDYFRIYNGYRRYPSDGWKLEPIYDAIAQAHGKASDCVGCQACERSCPQQIPITQWLAKVAEAWK